MSTMQSEVFAAFRAINIPEDKALRAAEALSKYNDSSLENRDKDISILKSDASSIKSDILLLKWMLGTNITLTLLVLGKLFLLH